MPVSSTTRPTSSPTTAIPGARRVGTLDEVLAVADFVSLHMPGGAENTHLIDAAALAR